MIDRPGQAVLAMDGVIQAVTDEAALACPPDARVIDGRGATLAPGFIDMQVNGGFGMDFTIRPESIWQVGRLLTRYGVTTFLPTIITAPLEAYARAQKVMTAGHPAGYLGAEPLGLHMEGPFLSPGKKGAHNPVYLRLPSPDLVKDWTLRNGVRLVTLAPELPGALPTIESLVGQGVLVSAGHSLADQKETEAGIAAGIRWGTHLFNAMPALEHRAANLTGVLLTDDRVGFGLIADGIHVDPLMIKLAWRAKGGRGLVLVTDAMAALGLSAGVSRLADFDVIVDETSARLADGTLAGSILTEDTALRNLMRFTGCSLAEALAALTTAPAARLGLTDRGQIKPGLRADFVLLDEKLQVAATLVGGELVYERGASPESSI
ncbi:N-acetylglucosamine 6-phosphate deacetylase [Longilinea arvoryzae]|uniref:N-acetylglucosamine 6-phosphate deacetylase n=1 Tax=Longilinea arvoryzae TaxID=360412 RepID=A0A0S7BGS0_9CHLR|nr:N-acetylglucosamine-6-phosphate deacetylase [Longilinea arvoryzae]GAP13747.1 N-acetylglucosamine 6-phosphate deacetylase [Longilinea arvoryzae]